MSLSVRQDLGVVARSVEHLPRAMVSYPSAGVIKLAGQTFTKDVAKLSCCA